MTAGPLSRFTVLDLTRVRAGPTCVRYFADWGANCIKIELPPGSGEDMGGPRHGPDFQNLHRNKRSITLNLKEPEGKAIFMKLVEKADVVVENFSPGVLARPAHRAKKMPDAAEPKKTTARPTRDIGAHAERSELVTPAARPTTHALRRSAVTLLRAKVTMPGP